MAYTPGPWTLEEVGDKVKHLCPAKDNTSLLTIAVEYDDNDEAHYFASVWSRDDARLIAAAPEFLDNAIDNKSKMELAYDAVSKGLYDEALLHLGIGIAHAEKVISKATGA